MQNILNSWWLTLRYSFRHISLMKVLKVHCWHISIGSDGSKNGKVVSISRLFPWLSKKFRQSSIPGITRLPPYKDPNWEDSGSIWIPLWPDTTVARDVLRAAHTHFQRYRSRTRKPRTLTAFESPILTLLFYCLSIAIVLLKWRVMKTRKTRTN